MAENLQAAPKKASTKKKQKAAAKAAANPIDFKKLAQARDNLRAAHDLMVDANATRLAEQSDKLLTRVDSAIESQGKASEKRQAKAKAKLEKMIAQAKAAGIDLSALIAASK